MTSLYRTRLSNGDNAAGWRGAIPERPRRDCLTARRLSRLESGVSAISRLRGCHRQRARLTALRRPSVFLALQAGRIRPASRQSNDR
jgi:hypothetical protein